MPQGKKKAGERTHLLPKSSEKKSPKASSSIEQMFIVHAIDQLVKGSISPALAKNANEYIASLPGIDKKKVEDAFQAQEGALSSEQIDKIFEQLLGSKNLKGKALVGGEYIFAAIMDLVFTKLAYDDSNNMRLKLYYASNSFTVNLQFVAKYFMNLPQTLEALKEDIKSRGKIVGILQGGLLFSCFILLGIPNIFTYLALTEETGFPKLLQTILMPVAGFYGLLTRTIGPYRVIKGLVENAVDIVSAIPNLIEKNDLSEDEKAFHQFLWDLKKYKDVEGIKSLRFDPNNPGQFITEFYQTLKSKGLDPTARDIWGNYVKPYYQLPVQVSMVVLMTLIVWNLFDKTGIKGLTNFEKKVGKDIFSDEVKSILGKLCAIGNTLMYDYGAYEAVPTFTELVEKYHAQFSKYGLSKKILSIFVAMVLLQAGIASGAAFQEAAKQLHEHSGFGLSNTNPNLMYIAVMILNLQTQMAHANDELLNDLLQNVGGLIQQTQQAIHEDILKAQKKGIVPEYREYYTDGRNNKHAVRQYIKRAFSDSNADVIARVRADIVARRCAELKNHILKACKINSKKARKSLLKKLGRASSAIIRDKPDEASKILREDFKLHDEEVIEGFSRDLSKANVNLDSLLDQILSSAQKANNSKDEEAMEEAPNNVLEEFFGKEFVQALDPETLDISNLLKLLNAHEPETASAVLGDDYLHSIQNERANFTLGDKNAGEGRWCPCLFANRKPRTGPEDTEPRLSSRMNDYVAKTK